MPRKLLALTGLTCGGFDTLLVAFSRVSQEKATLTADGQPRQRKPSDGRKATLALQEDRLLFILVYLKTYPLQEVMGELFDMEVSKVNEWIHRLLPMVRDALDDLGALPERDAKAVAKAQAKRASGKEVIIDGTERRRQRPKKPEKQVAHYSGKKKTHTDKDIVLADKRTKRVSYLSQTYAGTAHDKKIADHEGIVYAKDTGFQSYNPKVACSHQSEKPRGRELTRAEKLKNRSLSSVRVRAEHAICGIKGCRITKDVSRNTRHDVSDIAMVSACSACGLHNLRVDHRMGPLRK